MSEAPSSSNLYVSFMEEFYAQFSEYGTTLIRVITGLILMPHGAQKLFGMFGGSAAGTAGFFTKIGLEPALPLVYLVGTVELVGGALLVIGLFTRIAAAGICIAMTVAFLLVHLGNGYFWTKGGYEFPMLLAFIGLAFFLRGGGAHSLDRSIGKEF